MNPASPPHPAAPQDAVDIPSSWLRSRAHGLEPGHPLNDALLPAAALRQRQEANARLLTFSRPVLDNLYRQIDSPASTVLLADSEGLILSAVGCPDFLDRAARVALSPGASWDEATMGTNAIGTALHEGSAVTVRGAEHFLARNRFLTCVATPILAPGGGVLGILDVSTDARADLSHADALLRTTAELIEHQLIESLDEGFLTLRFHPRAELLGSPLEGLARFDEAGCLLASNRSARSLLALHHARPAAVWDDCFATGWRELVGWAAMRQQAPFPLRAARGRTFVARATLCTTRRPAASRAAAPEAPPPRRRATAANSDGHADGHSDVHSDADAALASLRLGDARLGALLDSLRDAGSTRAFLIEGETGSGKTHLAHCIHRLGGRATLVTLDCSAPGDDPGAATRLAAALQDAAGGDLLVKEFGALPAHLQTHLLRATAAGSTPQQGVRLIGTTTRPAQELAAGGQLDLALFERHGGRLLSLPPLRERSDFDALVCQFVREFSPLRPIYVCPSALTELRRHRWPGNLRELRNQLRLILALMGDYAEQLCPEDIPAELLEDDPSPA